MGVYFPNMEIPNSCSECRCGDGYACYVTGRLVQDEEWETTRSASCPLVPVPKHGRLIDADALLRGCKRIEGKYATREFAFSQSAIENAPTILDAEEGE